MKDNNKTRTMQPQDVRSIRPDAASSSSRVYSRTITNNITGDVISAALMEALFDKDRRVAGEEEGVWIDYNVREMRHATNLTAPEQREARNTLIKLKLVNFAVHHQTEAVKFIINHPLFREKLEEQIGKPLSEVVTGTTEL
jgi:hypothetical protein